MARCSHEYESDAVDMTCHPELLFVHQPCGRSVEVEEGRKHVLLSTQAFKIQWGNVFRDPLLQTTNFTHQSWAGIRKPKFGFGDWSFELQAEFTKGIQDTFVVLLGSRRT
ncbi:hypothetical protein JCM4814A_00530 [Streptomyces phaeofaciens JCM 4814]|uniref:Uncharacterized protein n=1 Tax=Streptomyces phaeofaciens TaxID=68254 RepID=A0A918M1N9_9ACTN|nr:hypothetical protein GCM10010226_87810 [Streptomyces phaeofaciens]